MHRVRGTDGINHSPTGACVKTTVQIGKDLVNKRVPVKVVMVKTK